MLNKNSFARRILGASFLEDRIDFTLERSEAVKDRGDDSIFGKREI
jgi:hypothetical protein